jgi:hypothetical protein
MLRSGSKWSGPIYTAAGLLMLGTQLYCYVARGLLSAWLIGGGIGLLLTGGAAWFYHLDDLRSGARLSSVDDFPTTEEYDRNLNEVESKEN